ncbi:MAG: GatB/YqeY domain-containing protein, partial [Flavobacteriia bacterium]|nr:GatB/YqeY domain-containing protein [Flavobacteriia bacterium]
MSIAVQINDQIKQAMLAKEKDRLAALRDIKSKLLLEATSGGGSEVSDEVAIKICMKLYKQRMETYDLYITQGRHDLADEELVQAKVIEEFLPKQLSEVEIKAEIQEAIAALGVEGP